MSGWSKNQIDNLGDRLRAGEVSALDLQLLDEYRRAFGPASLVVQERIRTNLGLAVTGRHKTNSSIAEKLRREQTRHARLSQIQDIAGCRIVLSHKDDQNRIVNGLLMLFPDSTVHDRSKADSNGYRAVHVVATVEGYRVEIQVRTRLQHLWAEFCERLADKLGSEIKYGGNQPVQTLLRVLSDGIRALEETSDDLVRETPVPFPVLHGDFVSSLKGLISFVENGPAKTGKDNDVFPD